ncbi:MAG: polyphosphate polymerase domain-containing protein [Planctomycetia bacterium]|nr:polyphosphate polymerase domain-containing protein [Planctomycetia bacterium]
MGEHATEHGGQIRREETRFLSPSLRAQSADSFTYELKFLIPAAVAAQLEARARGEFCPDPHGDPALGGAYAVTTVYLDTPGFDVFHRARELEGAKLRVRRYGSGALVYLERKQRRGDRVQKRRSAVEGADLAVRMGGVEAGWAGEWFRDEVAARLFQPVCRLDYERAAWFGTVDARHFRLTIDRRIAVSPACGWEPGEVREARPAFPGQAVCEMKFRDSLPAPLRAIVADFGLSPAGVSKYRQACALLGIVPGAEGADA